MSRITIDRHELINMRLFSNEPLRDYIVSKIAEMEYTQLDSVVLIKISESINYQAYEVDYRIRT